MRIETICTGDELLTGLTADTNSRYFQELLLDRTGLQVRRSVVVGDVREDIIEALDAAAARCDVVLVSGGLGPTADDITVDCAAEAAGVTVIEDQSVIEHLKERYVKRGFVLTELNRRQARRPVDAEAVINQEGAAPLIVHHRGACTFFFVPGVPREYRHLVERHVVSRVAALAAKELKPEVRELRLLRTVGIPESQLDAKVRPLFEKHPQVIFGFRTHPPENQLKLMATGADSASARRALDAAERDARTMLGRVVFGVDEHSLPEVVLDLLRARKETVSCAESCTGGLVSARLTDPAGASDVMLGGAVTYATSLKESLAHVAHETIATYTAVSAEVALEMARGIRKTTGSTWGVSTTGIAGPTGGTEVTPVGTVFVAASNGERDIVERHLFIGDRERIRRFASFAALDVLRRLLEDVKS